MDAIKVSTDWLMVRTPVIKAGARSLFEARFKPNSVLCWLFLFS